MENNKELNLELNLDDLESVNGGSGLSDAILNSEPVAEFIQNNKAAGATLEVCINLACDYLRSYLDRYITRDQVIALVTKIYDSI